MARATSLLALALPAVAAAMVWGTGGGYGRVARRGPRGVTVRRRARPATQTTDPLTQLTVGA